MPMHHSHPSHELSLTRYKKRYMCDGCKMDGHGERYRCTQFCNYDLHKECMQPMETLTLEAFPGLTFKYMDQPPPGRRSKCCGPTYCGRCRACDVCGMTVKGFVYHCEEEGFDVHPMCAMLKGEIRADDVVFELRNGVMGKCNCCKRKKLKGSVGNVPGFGYVSRCEEHSFHVYCLMGMGMGMGMGGPSDELEIPDLRVQRNICPRRGGTTKIVNVVKLFLKIVLSVLFGDPTAILASVVVELLTS